MPFFLLGIFTFSKVLLLSYPADFVIWQHGGKFLTAIFSWATKLSHLARSDIHSMVNIYKTPFGTKIYIDTSTCLQTFFFYIYSSLLILGELFSKLLNAKIIRSAFKIVMFFKVPVPEEGQTPKRIKLAGTVKGLSLCPVIYTYLQIYIDMLYSCKLVFG